HAAALELFARQWCDVPEDVVEDAFLNRGDSTLCRTETVDPRTLEMQNTRDGGAVISQDAF
ncbi:MAG: hypothetical protein WBC80_16235, partial [Isosphaeraceae bacterium]